MGTFRRVAAPRTSTRPGERAASERGEPSPSTIGETWWRSLGGPEIGGGSDRASWRPPDGVPSLPSGKWLVLCRPISIHRAPRSTFAHYSPIPQRAVVLLLVAYHYAGGPERALVVVLYDGITDAGTKAEFSYFLWPVRGGQ